MCMWASLWAFADRLKHVYFLVLGMQRLARTANILGWCPAAVCSPTHQFFITCCSFESAAILDPKMHSPFWLFGAKKDKLHERQNIGGKGRENVSPTLGARAIRVGYWSSVDGIPQKTWMQWCWRKKIRPHRRRSQSRTRVLAMRLTTALAKSSESRRCRQRYSAQH